MLKRSGATRVIGLAIITIFVGLIVVRVALGIAAYNERPILGTLSFDANQLPDQTHNIDQFAITWNQFEGGSLSITHQDDPDFLVWSTNPGRSFAATAIGDETVTERRGHFTFKEKLVDTCPNQTIDSIVASGNQLLVTGVLQCLQSASAPYVLTLEGSQPDQLRFELAVDRPEFNRTYLTYASDADERFYGFGEQFSAFDMKGRRLPIYVNEQGIGRGLQPLTLIANIQYGVGGHWYSSYAGVPHYITSQLHSLFLENSEYTVFDLRYPGHVHIQLHSPTMSGRILYGDSPAALIEEYSSYAGRMRPLPDWVHDGAIVSLQGGTERVREKLSLLEANEAPITGLWLQDWVGQRKTSFGEQLWWNWELDEDRYPEWDALTTELAANDIRLLTYINPFVTEVSDKPNVDRDLYQEAVANDYLVKNDAGEPYLIQNSDFSAGLVDFTNPAARDWMRNVITDELIGAGASGWMADFGEGLPYDARLASGESAAAYHNRYPEEWAKINREAVEAQPNAEDFLFFMRSGYRHSPMYSTAFWAGDQLVSWDAHDGIKTSVVALLSSGISGYSLNHSDIGGYTSIDHSVLGRHRSQELLMRWMELNAFTALYRSHESNRPTDNIQVYDNQELLDHFDRFARIYRALGYYRKQLVLEAADTGLPVVRHMFIHYPDDENVYDITYQQFMLGDQFIIAPVLDEGAERVSVYLPAGRWTHLWSGQTYGSADEGVTVTVDAPLGQPGVFYPQDSPVAQQLLAGLRNEGVID